MDRNAILSGYIDSYRTYSASDARDTVEKVLKYSGQTFDITRRGDIKTEVVVFKLLGGSTDYLVDQNDPQELIQNFQAIVYMEQSDKHSTKEARYNRMLELSDQLMDWSLATTGSSITADVYDLQFTGVTPVDEENGFLSTEVNFQSTIKTQ